MRSVRLVDPEIPFWVDLRIGRIGGCAIAVADLAGTPEIAAARDERLAVVLALWPLGAAVAQRLAATALVPSDEGHSTA